VNTDPDPQHCLFVDRNYFDCFIFSAYEESIVLGKFVLMLAMAAIDMSIEKEYIKRTSQGRTPILFISVEKHHPPDILYSMFRQCQVRSQHGHMLYNQ
jgi:hypothetical protein